MKKAISSIMIALFLVLLSLGLIVSAYALEGPMLAEERYSASAPLKVSLSGNYLILFNAGATPVGVSSIVINHDGALSFYNYSAVVLPGQHQSVYVSYTQGDRVGVETSGGAVWAG